MLPTLCGSGTDTGEHHANVRREGLIAVNYAARDKGITRHMRVAEARKVCPNIRLVHVETIGRWSGSRSGSLRSGTTQGDSLVSRNAQAGRGDATEQVSVE